MYSAPILAGIPFIVLPLLLYYVSKDQFRFPDQRLYTLVCLRQSWLLSVSFLVDTLLSPKIPVWMIPVSWNIFLSRGRT